jgi:hypothetical protein
MRGSATSFSLGTSCPPWLTRIATRSSDVVGPEVLTKQKEAVQAGYTVVLRESFVFETVFSDPAGECYRESRYPLGAREFPPVQSRIKRKVMVPGGGVEPP